MKLQIWRTDDQLPAFRNGGGMLGRYDCQGIEKDLCGKGIVLYLHFSVSYINLHI